MCVSNAPEGYACHSHVDSVMFSREGEAYGRTDSIRTVAMHMFHRVRDVARDAVWELSAIRAHVCRTRSGRAFGETDATGDALKEASVAGDAENVKRLRESGVRTDVCAAGDWAVFVYAVRTGDAETVRTLLCKSGVDVNALDGEGNRPLGLAVRGGHSEVVRELLYHNADVDGRDAGGRTPLAIAVEGSSEMTRELLGYGADVNIP
ncbi:MAG: ankyrin repeat domain-containing protein, partial [Simkaniaceae bacterium]|nr:ankyrin repeat domain-containing protein [Simkaniaceae bacterium]